MCLALVPVNRIHHRLRQFDPGGNRLASEDFPSRIGQQAPAAYFIVTVTVLYSYSACVDTTCLLLYVIDSWFYCKNFNMAQTALARQLKKLSVPQTHLYFGDKSRKSFLFDSRDAAALDRDVIFAHGTNGLEKLMTMNSIFSQFEQNLFHVSYKVWERSMQTALVNKKLDKLITEFLRLLSPYFLEKAAHEALEWLLFAFHIHLYNTDELIASVLPHFNTSVFVRVVQLLDLNDPNNRWYWLQFVQKTGVHLEYSILLNRINIDADFRKIVCDLAPNSFKTFQNCVTNAIPVISFSMVSLYNALEMKESLNNNMIIFLLPYLLKALKSNLNHYIASSYMILSSIILKVKLQESLIMNLLTKVFENITPDVAPQAYQLLLLTFQQQSIENISSGFFDLIVCDDECLQHLDFLAKFFEATSLISALTEYSFSFVFKERVANKKNFKFCKMLLISVPLSQKNVTVIINIIMDAYLNLQRKSKVKKKMICIFLKYLDKKYPTYFNKAIDHYFTKNPQNSRNELYELINTVSQLQNKILPDKKTTLVLGINHTDSHVRKSSIKCLLQFAKSGKCSDIKFIENSLYDRFYDDCPNIIMEMLSSPEILLRFVDKKNLLTGFEKILKKKIKEHSKWYQVQMCCIDILCNYYANEEYLSVDIFFILLPFIFPLQKASLNGFYCIMNSKLKTILPVLQTLELPNLSADKENIDEYLKFLNFSVFSSIKKYIDHLNSSSKELFLTSLGEKCTEAANYPLYTINIVTVGCVIISSNKLNEQSIWIGKLLTFLKSVSSIDKYQEYSLDSLDLGTITEDVAVHEYVEAIINGKFPQLVIYYTFHNIVKSINFIALNNDSWPFTDENKFLTFSTLMHLYEFCVNDISKIRFPVFNLNYLLTEFLHLQFLTDQHLISFLSLIWSDSYLHVPQYLQINALNSALMLCSNSKNFDWFFDIDFFCISLLKAMSTNDGEVRRKSFILLSALFQLSENTNSAFNVLFKYMYENSEEICIDHQQFYYAIKEWINPVVDMYSIKVSVCDISADFSKKYSVLHLFIKTLLDDNTPHSMKWFILLCLHEIDSSGILSACIPLMRKFLMLIEKSNGSNEELSLCILSLLFQKFTPKTATCLKEDCIETETFFKYFLLNKKDSEGHKYVMKNLSRDFFMAIPSVKVQQRLFHVLLDIYVGSPDCEGELKKVLQKLSTYAYLILKDFQIAESTQKNITLKALSKSKLEDKSNGSFDEWKTKEWKKIVVLLELIQNKSRLDKRELLIPELFNLLCKTLSFDPESTIEYVKQLILSTIRNCCQNLGIDGLDERQFQVELIVKCIRSSSNPETHRQALLLLNLSAEMFPDYVLKNIMTIFVFMGSSLVRQDDSYSFQVISQTIETIVPSLLAASSAREENDEIQIVASVIRVFVDSLCDIPGHRQMPLFHKLISTLEPTKYLWIPLAQICDQHTSELEFALNLHKQFRSFVQIDTCIALLNFLCLLPDSKEKTSADFAIIEPFNVSTHSNEQLQMYKHNVISYINTWLLSQSFVNQASELDSQTLGILEEKYEMLLEKAMKYLHHLRSLDLPDANEKLYRNNLLSLLLDLISRVNCLLPSNLFIKIVRHLLQSPEVIIQKKAIELLIDKLTMDQDLFENKYPKMLLKLLKPLLRAVKKSDVDSVEGNYEPIRQCALYALHLLTKVIGSIFPSKFHKVLNVSVQILKDNQNEALTINALLCLAQVCHSLGLEVLPDINSFMPVVIDLMINYEILTDDDNLILGIIATLHRLVEDLGAFLSKYLGSIVTGICMLYEKKHFNEKIICENLQKFQTLLATNINLRNLIPAIVNSYSEIMATNGIAILPLVEILKEKLNDCKFVETEECFVQMEQFFLVLLDFRNLNKLHKSVSVVECATISALTIYIKKLPVTYFKTFFQKIYLWATATEKKMKLRLFTFYNVTNHLSKSIKHLFLVVAKYFLKNAGSELDSNNSSKSEDIDFGDDPVLLFQHLINILDTLTECYLNDNHCLVDKDTFEFLMQPLVDQLENLSIGEKPYQEMIANHLSSCIAQFMTTVTDNTLWKKLNYQILLKTRNDSPLVRFAAIQVIREVATVMENDYLPLLPESIPFLAEVMEDESYEVEKECQSVITEMERILGEPIRKYF
ncbi:HEAT repeat-containing protein 1 [Nephila pilipes]|uniref:HEAT repeat-containing protein 1 n=1 Tax=Nephila pilipes TaxID=299642 RepID=A0A8X6UCM4_NEPPI|nr:HEAT repeat-containing protein 1 [Nephila pilipes]